MPPAQVTGPPEQSGSVVPVGGTTVAVLAILAAAALPTVHAIVNVALPPDAIAAPVQVPVPVPPDAMVPTVNVPAEGVKLQPVRPAGKDSTMEKVLAASMALGPALLMVRVYVNSWPTTTGLGLAVLPRLRSEVLVMGSLSVAEFGPGPGSVTPTGGDTVAVFTAFCAFTTPVVNSDNAKAAPDKKRTIVIVIPELFFLVAAATYETFINSILSLYGGCYCFFIKLARGAHGKSF